MSGNWYVTNYIKYPIYQIEEGGFYCEGATVSSHREFATRRKAMRYIRKTCRADKRQADLDCQTFWHSADHTEYGANGRYIGDGWYVRLERRLGEDQRGYVPFS